MSDQLLEPLAPLGGDLLRGVSTIADFLGVSKRRAFYLCERGYIPCGKEGASWVASKRALRAHYARATSAEGAAAA